MPGASPCFDAVSCLLVAASLFGARGWLCEGLGAKAQIVCLQHAVRAVQGCQELEMLQKITHRKEILQRSYYGKTLAFYLSSLMPILKTFAE